MTHKAIIFDFFGVICSEIAPFWLAKYVAPDEAMRIKEGLVHSADKGELSQDSLFEALGLIAHCPASEVLREWNEHVIVDQEMVDFVSAVRGRTRVALLTNSPAPFVRGILGRHALMPLFETVLISSEAHCAKPDPKIYKMMLHRLSLEAGETLLVDDNPANVAGARNVGMGALLFQSAAQCRDALRA